MRRLFAPTLAAALALGAGGCPADSGPTPAASAPAPQEAPGGAESPQQVYAALRAASNDRELNTFGSLAKIAHLLLPGKKAQLCAGMTLNAELGTLRIRDPAQRKNASDAIGNVLAEQGAKWARGLRLGVDAEGEPLPEAEAARQLEEVFGPIKSLRGFFLALDAWEKVYVPVLAKPRLPKLLTEALPAELDLAGDALSVEVQAESQAGPAPLKLRFVRVKGRWYYDLAFD